MNLLFDLDGTLTNSFTGITRCLSYALTRLDRTVPDLQKLKKCIGPPLKTSFAYLLDSNDDQLIEEALTNYRERFSSIGLFENEVYEDIPETLESLKKNGHILYVATSKPGVFAKKIINHFNLNKYFKGVFGSELDGTRGDKTALLSYLLENESISPSETIMIGDRKYDMIGAKANKISGLGVLWGFGTQEELETSGARTCILYPKELPAALAEFHQ